MERFDVLFAASHYGEAYTFILETLKRNRPSVSAVNKFISAAIAVKGRKFARRFCYHMLCTQPRGPELLTRYLFLCAETGSVEGIDAAVSNFPNHRGLVNDKINLLKAMAHSNNLDMYQSLDSFSRQPMDKHSIFSISQVIVMSAILGDRAYARKGLIGLYKYDNVYGGNKHEKINSNIKMHVRYNIIDSKMEILMVQLNSLMKEKKYDCVFQISGEMADRSACASL